MIFHASEMGLVSKEEVLERIEKGMEERGGEETKGPIGHHPNFAVVGRKNADIPPEFLESKGILI